MCEFITQPRAEEFDALVQELLPNVRRFLPYLSTVEALRTASLMAEYRMADEDSVVWTSMRTKPSAPAGPPGLL